MQQNNYSLSSLLGLEWNQSQIGYDRTTNSFLATAAIIVLTYENTVFISTNKQCSIQAFTTWLVHNQYI